MTGSRAAEGSLRREGILVTVALVASHHVSLAVLSDDQGLITLLLVVVPALMVM